MPQLDETPDRAHDWLGRTKRLAPALVIATAATACGIFIFNHGLTQHDRQLCQRVDTIGVYLDALGDSSDPESATSVFAGLSGADSEKLAQVGRDYAAAHPTFPDEYIDRAKRICSSN